VVACFFGNDGHMQRAVSIRKRFTPEERAKILADYQASGLTQQEFVRQAGISLAALGKWLTQARRQKPPQTTAVSFLEVAPADPRSADFYRVQLLGGMVLEVPLGFRAPEVEELLRLIRDL